MDNSLPFKSDGAEKRSLGRVRVGISNDLNVKLNTQDETFKCQVIDYNSLTVSVVSDEVRSVIELGGKIETLDLCYGNKVVATVKQPEIIRNDEGKLVFGLAKDLSGRGLRRKERLQIKPIFKPILMVKDPIKLDYTLSFTVLDLNGEGMLLSTSLSNKHVLIGQIFEGAQLVLPGVSVLLIHFRIVHVKKHDSELRMGIEFIGMSEDDLQAIAQYSIFGTFSDHAQSIQKKFEVVKENVVGLRSLSPIVKCEVVSSLQDYQETLAVRYAAYNSAGKVENGLGVEAMGDEYDRRSIIVIAKLEGCVVGTVRLVSSDGTDSFPFEKHFKFDEVVKTNSKIEIFEVSRLAILPGFQGSDILAKLFQEVARYMFLNKRDLVCLSTQVLKKIYLRLGFRQISEEVKHPVQVNETLSLLYIHATDFASGLNMPNNVWNRIAKLVVQNIESAYLFIEQSHTSDLLETFEHILKMQKKDS